MNWKMIILRIHSMLKAEREHLEFLKNEKAPEYMIQNSFREIARLKMRLEQYENYCAENNLV